MAMTKRDDIRGLLGVTWFIGSLKEEIENEDRTLHLAPKTLELLVKNLRECRRVARKTGMPGGVVSVKDIETTIKVLTHMAEARRERARTLLAAWKGE